MGWLGWRRLLKRSTREKSPTDMVTTPLPILVHAHKRDDVPAGPLEDGMMEIEQDGLLLHVVAEIVRPDGTFCDLAADRIEWASRLSYRHLKREGCLETYGVPVIPAYEVDSLT
jgi:hypothetical protein